MCGIYGILNLKQDSTPGAALLARMGKAVEHRGNPRVRMRRFYAAAIGGSGVGPG